MFEIDRTTDRKKKWRSMFVRFFFFHTRFFSKKIDVNKWDDMAELTQAMIDLYHSADFFQLKA
jgi:hypothetical protein